MSAPYPNPFCAARFAPGVLPWIGELEPLVDRTCVPNARLQILGPHGSGKSTLLAHLARHARMRGWQPILFRGSRGLRPLFEGQRRPGAPLVVLADEAEELGGLRLHALRAWCALRRAALVLTAHRDLGFETLCVRSVDAPLVRELVGRLFEDSSFTPDIDALLERHDGNVREVFFDLYDAVAAR